MRTDIFSPLDLAALALFGVCWLAYPPLQRLTLRGRDGIQSGMTVIRRAWMRNMAQRDNRFMDGQLLAQALNSASFFASSNLLLIAAAAGTLFGGESSFRSASSLLALKASSRVLFEAQLGLVIVALARGLLDFIWSIRQMNYCLAAMGAAPLAPGDPRAERYGDIVARMLNPALSSFNSGVRGYYFSLAAAAWLFGAKAFIAATLVAFVLLIWRQARSPTAAAIADLRRLLEEP